MGLSFTIAADLFQHIHSQVWVPQDSWPHLTVSDSRLPQPGAQVTVFIYPRNRVAQLYPRHCVPFPSPFRTHDHLLPSQIRDSPNLEPRSPYLYPPGTGWPSYTPWHCVPFPLPFMTRRAMMEIIWTFLNTQESQSAVSWCVNLKGTEHKTQHSRLLQKWLYVYSTEVNRFTKCTFLFDNPKKCFAVVTHFANVALVKQKYFIKCFPHAEVF
jgi:hypothetical protein